MSRCLSIQLSLHLTYGRAQLLNHRADNIELLRRSVSIQIPLDDSLQHPSQTAKTTIRNQGQPLWGYQNYCARHTFLSSSLQTLQMNGKIAKCDFCGEETRFYHISPYYNENARRFFNSLEVSFVKIRNYLFIIPKPQFPYIFSIHL